MSVLTRKISALEKNVLSDEPNPKGTYLGTNNKDENELFRLYQLELKKNKNVEQ